jgi:phage minor structural protein
MIPILYNTITEGTVPTDFGLGPLTDCLKAEVKEERNGAYELTLSYASDGIHAEDIQVNRFIMAKPNYTDSAQIFRIYKVGKAINGRFEVSAQHVAYDLSGKVISTGTASSCVAACTLLTAQAGSFTINTDKTVSASFTITEPSSVRSWFGGKAGSLLDVYGGEWLYNNYTATLKQARGTDRGVTIRFGKNLTEINQEVSIENLVTGIIPFYIDTDGNKTVGSKVNTGLVLDVPRDLAIDFSQDVDPESGTAIATQLANLAGKYITNNDLTNPLNNITLNFVQLEGLTERVDLCDTVHIYYEPLGITATAKCIATVWDVLEERYTQTTFGSPKTNIADTIATQAREVAQAPSRSFMNEAISHATELITGNLGGYVINGYDSNGDGYPDENLIMDTMDITTATKVIRSNLGGIGLSTTGYSGPFTTAITAEGIVATAITTGVLNADLIKAGTIEDANHNSTINMTTGVAVMKSFTAKGNFKIINDSNSKIMGYIFPYAEGGAVQLNDSNQNGRANLFATDTGGYLYLYNSSGTRVVEFNAYGSGTITGNFTASGSGYFANSHVSMFNSADGGNINVKNSSNNNVIWNFVGNSGQGEIYVGDGSTTNVYLHGGSGNITCVSLTQTSSRKVKENIKPIGDSEKILELNAVSFDFKAKAQGTDKRGFIAEEVAEVLPNLVTPETEDSPASLDYIGMIPYLQDIIKKQEQRIQALEEKINKLGG